MLRGMPRPVAHYRAAPPSANRRHCIAARSRMHGTVYAGLPTGLPMDTVPPSIPTVARMSDAPIAAIELHHVALPTRREHKWTGLTEPIGGYVLGKMIDAAGAVGWGEAPALKDWGGDFGRYFGESPATTIEIITRYLTPAGTHLSAATAVSSTSLCWGDQAPAGGRDPA